MFVSQLYSGKNNALQVSNVPLALFEISRPTFLKKIFCLTVVLTYSFVFDADVLSANTLDRSSSVDEVVSDKCGWLKAGASPSSNTTNS